MLREMLLTVPDKRRVQARQYEQGDLLFFGVLGILCGATSYRKLHIFMKEHWKYLRKKYALKSKIPPSYSTIRKVIHGVEPKKLEKAFREHATFLAEMEKGKYRFINLDGKTLRGSYDNFEDQKAIQVFSAFLTGANIILAHEEIEGQKTNEIPVAQELIKKLGLKDCVFTGDAMHCQKKHSKS